jgi:hypothetical protein
MGRIDMSTATKWIVAAACAGLVACSTQPPKQAFVVKEKAKPYKVKECKTGGANACSIGVKVMFSAQGTPYLAVDDADMFVSVKRSQPATITWTLSAASSSSAPGSKTEDFEFTASGIDFGDAMSQIPCTKRDKRVYECAASRLSNVGLTAYKYSVNVVDVTGASTNTTISLDPWVVAD